MKIFRNDNPPTYTPPAHFGGLVVADIFAFDGRDFAMQTADIPPGGGGELHHHDTWSQMFYIVEGQLTFDTGRESFELVAGQSVLFEPMDPHHTLNEGSTAARVLVVTVKHATP